MIFNESVFWNLGKGLHQFWMNPLDPKMGMQPPMQEEEDVDDEEMGVAETYADYMPTKCEFITNYFFFLTSFTL